MKVYIERNNLQLELSYRIKCLPILLNISCDCFHIILNEYSNLQENPYNVRYIHTVLIIHIWFASQVMDAV